MFVMGKKEGIDKIIEGIRAYPSKILSSKSLVELGIYKNMVRVGYYSAQNMLPPRYAIEGNRSLLFEKELLIDWLRKNGCEQEVDRSQKMQQITPEEKSDQSTASLERENLYLRILAVRSEIKRCKDNATNYKSNMKKWLNFLPQYEEKLAQLERELNGV